MVDNDFQYFDESTLNELETERHRRVEDARIEGFWRGFFSAIVISLVVMGITIVIMKWMEQ